MAPEMLGLRVGNAVAMVFGELSREGAIGSPLELARRIQSATATDGVKVRASAVPMWHWDDGPRPPVMYVRLALAAGNGANRASGHVWWLPDHIHRAVGSQIKVVRHAERLRRRLGDGRVDEGFVCVVDPVGELSAVTVAAWERELAPVMVFAWSRRWGRVDHGL